ncbi:MAG TPA: PAS domain S-box protein [Thermoanaerobaculia bacterium]
MSPITTETACDEAGAQQAIRESEERYRLLSRAVNDVVWEWDLRTDALFWNEGVQTLFGYPPEEVEPTIDWWYRHIVEEDRDRVVEGIHRFVESDGEMWSDEYRFRCRNGEIATIMDRGIISRDLDGRPLRMVGAMLDITLRRRTEDTLNLHSLVLRNMSEGVSLSSEDGIIVFTNAASDAMFGYQRGELLGQHVTVLNDYLPEENERIVGAVIGQLATRGVWSGTWRNRRKDGTPFITDARITRLDIGGKPHWVCVQKDVTEELRIAEAVRHSEERYRSLVEATAAIVWNTSAAGEFETEQPGWTAFTGQTREELLGWGWLAKVHPDDQAETVARWKSALAQRSTYAIEHRVRRADGEYRSMSARAVPIVESDGTVREWVGIHTDVTPERLLQQQIETERARLRDIFERAPGLIATLRGPDHIFESANPAYSQVLGENLVGKPVREALPEAVEQGFVDLLDAVYLSGEPYVGRELPLTLHRNGRPEQHYFDFVYEPLREADGHISGIFAHATDVTEQVHARRVVERQAEELERANLALQYQSQLNRTITDNAASCLFMMDENGHPTFMNPAAVEVTGYTLDEIRDAPLHAAVHHTHPDGRPFPISECPIDNGLRQLAPLRDYRDTFVRKDGTFFPVSCHVAPIERDGRTSGAVMEFRDITDELRAQEALRDVDRRKDEFLATLSHELRTPLTAILGWARMLNIGGLDEETMRIATRTIEESAQVQAQLIDDVLDLSRIISGKIRIQSNVVNAAQIASSAAEGVRLAAAAKHIRLEVDSGEHPEELQILGDANRLQQVIWNLLTNAIKFTPEGGAVKLFVRRRESTVVISATDSGIGIRPEFLPHVFEPFRQAEDPTTRSHGGLGLGLSIVRHLVELHGGTIRAFSEGEGRGATFTVTLPLLRHLPAEREGGDVAAAPAPLEAQQFADLTGRSLLVVDDQQAVREFFEVVLRRSGARVRGAASVQEAIAAVREELPDTIICDIAMPDEDGYAFLQWLRADDGAGRTPVVAVTAFGRPEDRQRILEAGFDAYLRKPVEPGELTRVVAGM